jgi:hypothetical protein
MLEKKGDGFPHELCRILGSPKDGDTPGMQKNVELGIRDIHGSFLNLLMDSYPSPFK